MKRSLMFLLSVFLISISSGRSFAQCLGGPENLKFSRIYFLSGMPRKAIYEYIIPWVDTYTNMRPNCGGAGKYGYEGYGRSGFFYNLDFGKEKGVLHCCLYTNFYYGYFELQLTDISVYWRDKMELFLYTEDTRDNRTWFWRLITSKKIMDHARERSKEIFEMFVASLEEYMEKHPLKRVEK